MNGVTPGLGPQPGPNTVKAMLASGDRAPTLHLPDAATGEPVTDPWREGAVVLAFFKTTCPVCQMAAPKVQAMAESGVRVVAVGEDAPPEIRSYAERHGQRVTTLSEPAPYPVSDAFGIDTVPTLFLVGEEGTVRDTVVSWDRDAWNRFAQQAGGTAVSEEGDGLPPFRPG
ncbi:MAG TPA: TlpA disulfide reductase family protein [Acidimicrobiia bacterium]|nr:TlpA disulfide reductase family protein [Acidimicrobiia bacterium]